MRTLRLEFIFAVAIALLGIEAASQLSPLASSPGQAPTVTLPFFADDGHGHPVPRITAFDLSILDDKKPPQTVLAITAGNEVPLRIGLLVDTSTSEGRSDLYLPEVHGASGFLFQVLNGTDDKGFILTFAETLNASAFMSRNELKSFKADVTPHGGTALYDAVFMACRERMETDPTEPARRVLVILSDGEDTASHVDHDKALAAAQESRTVVFVVSTGEGSHPHRSGEIMQQLAEKTGGRVFADLSRKNFSKAFSAIQEEIEHMYTVTYVPAESGPPGKRHAVELKPAAHEKFKVRAPKSY